MNTVQTFIASLVGVLVTIGIICFVMWKDCTNEFNWWSIIAIVVSAVVSPIIYKRVFTDLNSSKEA
jgi:phosphate/sulfate permease